MTFTFWKWKKAMMCCAVAAATAIVLFSSLNAHAELPRRMLELELEEVEGGAGYEIQVVKLLADGTKKPPVTFKIKSNVWSARLVPGKYEMRSRSLDRRGVPGDWGKVEAFEVRLPPVKLKSPAPNLIVKSKEDKTDKIEFSWEEAPGAESYNLIIRDSKQNEKRVTTRKNAADFELPVANDYTWTVTANLEGLESEPADAQNFRVQGKPIDAPEFGPITDINTNRIEWSQPNNATEYQYTLEKKTKGKWLAIQKKRGKPSLALFAKPLTTGQYRVKVQAFGPNRDPSDVAATDFYTEKTNRSPAAIEQMRSEGAFESRGRYFFVASYQATLLNYESNISDSNGPNSMSNALAGTGRLGVGRWFREGGPAGVQLIADMSGFIGTTEADASTGESEKTQNFIYYSVTAQGLYRLRLGALGQVRLGAGVLYRTLPVVSREVATNNFQVSEIATLGPVVSAALAHGFTRTLGMQLNAMFMHSTVGMSIPAGGTNEGKPGYQVGILGSSQFIDNLIGFAGVAYREESAAYRKDDAQNTVTMKGMYLNFMLEYGF